MGLTFFRRKPKTDDANVTLIDTDSPAPPPASQAGTSAAASSAAKAIRLYGLLFAILALITSALVVYQQRNSANATLQVAAASEMQMLSQQIAKAAQLAMRGNDDAFNELENSRQRFEQLLGALSQGGDTDLGRLTAVASSLQSDVANVANHWKESDSLTRQLLTHRESLHALNTAAATISDDSEPILAQAQAINHQLQAGSADAAILSPTARAVQQIMMLSQRVAKNANALLAADSIDSDVAFALGYDTDMLHLQFDALAEEAVAEPLAALREPIKELTDSATPSLAAASAIVGRLQLTAQAKQAGQGVFANANPLLDSAATLSKQLSETHTRFSLTHALIALGALASTIALVLMALHYRSDMARRRIEAEQQRERAEHERNLTQQAILRLMNEMGDLADGDLTVRATVTEDITGAIADSVNYTVEELAVLVSRINDAASRVTSATQSAQRTSNELLQAAEQQSHEIEEAGTTVQRMAQSMTDASEQALHSAQVARRSLSVTRKGADAVENTIRGMNDIRGQIQETSKRIKRLGESSQEIGEIVELISDITEQTNVLALNAAIQAASAGEAGRGFTVVAEEVQRLAERSAEATKQIAAIVKTIQADTQDAVSAMENATHDVVQGAQLSDAAGQALSEIDAVSLEAAQLIEQISVNTQEQASTASRVAATMKDILTVTEQTTFGTQQTAVSIGQLAELAVELKGSVSGFKV